ncbi:hypothetical protein GGH91_000633 [Coemansia sp. RSA 2671]|nr:hypothetical protein LPJ60_000608 [Coemansia sp. RSA 2675]KAJ2349735.1 hypothetical protein GGH91_000633 [Coemansia sp. RSA 2671]
MLCNGRVRSLGVSSWRDGRPVSLGLQSESELTMIMSGPNDECASFAMLAYLNSRTLTAIHAKIQHVHDWLDLICGNANTPVAFTSLKTLSLNIANVDYSDEWAGIEGVIMFPNLSTLEVTGAYPFADDMLFRGNGSTIRYLHLPFKTIAANVLEKVGILGCTGVAQMKQIRFGDSTEADKEVIARNGWEHITRQLPLILNMTTSLQLSGDGPTYEVYKSMVTMRVETSIQHLDVRNLVYRHDHVIRVIGALPNLVSFTAEVAHIESRGDVPERYKSPSDLYKRYYPVGSNFRVLCVPLMTEFSGCQIAEEVVRIAIVCQNLVQVHVPPHDRSMFKRAVSWAIDSSEFAPYADSLRHLL